MYSDASAVGLGACLTQLGDNNKEHPIAFASKRCSERELLFPIRERECLSCVWATEKFRTYLIGRKFTIYTDHKSLQWLKSYQKNDRVGRYALHKSQLEYKIEYRKRNPADALSRMYSDEYHSNGGDIQQRISENEIFLFFAAVVDDIMPTREQLVQAQADDPLLGRSVLYLMGTGPKTPEVKEVLKSKGKYLIDQETGLLVFSSPGFDNRVVVPSATRGTIIKGFHDTPTAAHVGVNKAFNNMRPRFYWRGMKDDMAKYIRSCEKCQKRKPNRPLRHALLVDKNFSSDFPFNSVALDPTGPFPLSKNNMRYVAIFICRFTR